MSNHYYIAQLPPPYGPKYGIFNEYIDYYGKLAYSTHKTSGIHILYLADTVEEAIRHFATIPNPLDRQFYPQPSSLTDFGIHERDLEPIYSISDNHPELFI